MRPRYLAVLLATVLLSSALQAQVEVDSLRIIFPAEKILRIGYDTLPRNRRFTPTLDEVNKADRAAVAHLPGRAIWYQRETGEKIDIECLKYYRQYFGIVEDGKLLIWIAGACKRRECFTKYPCIPKGGGACYFRMKVKARTFKLVEFTVNASR